MRRSGAASIVAGHVRAELRRHEPRPRLRRRSRCSTSPSRTTGSAGIAPALRAADVAIGHLEVPHTRHHRELRSDVPAPGADPAHVPALARAGFHAVSLAGNHIADCGAVGIADTIARWTRPASPTAARAPNLDAARAPCFLTAAVRRVAVLSYNCVGPEECLGDRPRAPAALMCASTPPTVRASPRAPRCERAESGFARRTWPHGHPRARAPLARHGRRRAAQGHRAHARAAGAVRARASRMRPSRRVRTSWSGHHAHIVRGIEFHRGKPIFHGLGNGCVVTRALSPDSDDPARAEWARRAPARCSASLRIPAIYLAPFHPEAVNAMLGRVRVARRRQPADRIHSGSCRCAGPAARLADEREAQGITRYIEADHARQRDCHRSHASAWTELRMDPSERPRASGAASLFYIGAAGLLTVMADRSHRRHRPARAHPLAGCAGDGAGRHRCRRPAPPWSSRRWRARMPWCTCVTERLPDHAARLDGTRQRAARRAVLRRPVRRRRSGSPPITGIPSKRPKCCTFRSARCACSWRSARGSLALIFLHRCLAPAARP